MLHHSPTRSKLRAMGQAICPKLLRSIGWLLKGDIPYASHFHNASDYGVQLPRAHDKGSSCAQIMKFAQPDDINDCNNLARAEVLCETLGRASPKGAAKFHRGKPYWNVLCNRRVYPWVTVPMRHFPRHFRVGFGLLRQISTVI